MIRDIMNIMERLNRLEAAGSRGMTWGKVESVDLDAGRVVVNLGGEGDDATRTPPIPWAVLSTRAYFPPEVDDLAIVLAPAGELGMSVALCGIAISGAGKGNVDEIEGGFRHDRDSGDVVLAEGDKLLALAEKVDSELTAIETTLDSLTGQASFTIAYVNAGSVAASRVKGQ